MWNRLAIVVTALVSIGVPLANGIEKDLFYNRFYQEVEWPNCKRTSQLNGFPYDKFWTDPAYKACDEKARGEIDAQEKWFFTTILPRQFSIIMVLCGAVYLVIRLIVGTASWVLRGRDSTN